jgi:G3E family GTPase
MTPTPSDLIPLIVITGFLGSGKTTLLRKLLTSDLGGETAVLINELGEIGIDNLLVGEIAPDTVLLKSGCVCCSIRGDLKDALVQLYSRRQKKEIPSFRRIILETTGLADPAPIFATVLADPMLRHHFSLGVIIAVVDSFNASLHEQLHPEWMAQVTAADRLILAKTDLVSEQNHDTLRKHLRRINPTAVIMANLEVKERDPLLLGAGLHEDSPESEAERWIRNFAHPSRQEDEGADIHTGHADSDHPGVTSFCLVFDHQIDWTAFGLWLSLLLNRHGRSILRVKGILNLSGSAYPIAIHGVQHLVHPPVHLSGWPDSDRRSRIVFIVRGIERDAIERSLNTFCQCLGCSPF